VVLHIIFQSVLELVGKVITAELQTLIVLILAVAVAVLVALAEIHRLQMGAQAEVELHQVFLEDQ
jgi:hypothetical protein